MLKFSSFAPRLYYLFQYIPALFYHWNTAIQYLNLSDCLGFIDINAWKLSRTRDLGDSNCFHFSWTSFESNLFSRCFWSSTGISSTDLGMEVCWKNSSIRNQMIPSIKSLIPSHKRKWSPLFITLLSVVGRVYTHKNILFHVPNQWRGFWTSWGYAVEALLCIWNLVIQKYSMNRIKASSSIW